MLVEFSFIKLLKEKARHQFFNFEYRRISNNSYKNKIILILAVARHTFTCFILACCTLQL